MRLQLKKGSPVRVAKSRHKVFSFGRQVATPGVMATAMLLSGVQLAHADTAPERALIAYKYLDYKDWQPGLDRISVHAPSVMLMTPITGEWAVEGVLTSDSVSGASPAYHSEPSSFASMHDVRRGRDLHVTRYFSRGSLTFGGSFSNESDYASHAYSVSGSISSEDKNTTLNLGASITRDRIYPSNQIVENEHKTISEVMFGITQVLSIRDIAQFNFTHVDGRGYYSDPYKYFDNRPREKRQDTALLRWNHYFDATDGSTRLGYRYYTDSFGIRAHTLTAEYVQPLPGGWNVTPLARLYSQSAARFYLDPVNPPDPTLPDGFVPGQTIFSLDQRLSAFGARSYGLKLANQFHRDWLVDIKYERYEQRSDWRIDGRGSPGLAPLNAQIVQVGITHFF